MASLFHHNRGQSLVELLIALGLASLLIPTLITGVWVSRQARPQTIQRTFATGLLREGTEAVRSIRARGWSEVATAGTYYLSVTANAWTFITSPPEVINGYTRTVVISDTQRNPTGAITPTGTIDPSTKLITITVSWISPRPSSVSTQFYLTRYRDNLAHIESTQADFNAIGAVPTNTAVEATSGSPLPDDGQIVLSGGGKGDWCKPNLSAYQFNFNHSASANAITAIEGRAFAGTGNDASGMAFYDITIFDTNPPTAVSAGTVDGYKTYSVFGDSDYGYIATDSNAKQGVVIKLATHTAVSWLDAGAGNIKGRSITVANNLAYLATTDNKIYIFDISTKTGTHTPIAVSPSLGGVSHKIIVMGTNLYAAVNSTSNQLVILPLTNNGRSFGPPVNISVAGQGGKDVFVKDDNPTRAYLATSVSASQREVFIIDIDPASPTYKQSVGHDASGNYGYDTSGMDPQGITKVTNNKVIIVGIGGVEYQVVDVANDVISYCSATYGDFNIKIYGLASVIEAATDGDAYSYILTDDPAAEFQIIEGGPNGKSSTSGSFESAPFDAQAVTGNSQTFFNRLFYTALTNPPTTVISFQVAAADAVNNSCLDPGVAYVYQELLAGGAIPAGISGSGYRNPARCFRYKAALSSTSLSSSPVLNDVTVNYSP